MNSNYGNREVLERNILVRIIWTAVAIIFLYAAYHLFFSHELDRLLYDASILVLFIVCYLLMRNTKWTVFNKRVVAILFFIAVTISFFLLGGFFGIASMDICTLVLILSVVFTGTERKVFISLGFILILFYASVHVFFPEAISDRKNDPVLFDVLEMLIRFMLIFNVGLVFKTEYEKERNLVLEINKRLYEKNLEIAEQNLSIGTANEKLEKVVAERTRNIKKLNKKLAEYVSFNSHKVRAPLARILGLIYLIKINIKTDNIPGSSNTEEYFEKLLESANELDNVVKEINTLLSERTSLLKKEEDLQMNNN